MTRDVDGSEVSVRTNWPDPTPIPNCQNGFVKLNLATVQQTCLLELDFSLSVHVTAPDQGGWVFAETYNSTPASAPWFAYTNELLQIKLDGTEVRDWDITGATATPTTGSRIFPLAATAAGLPSTAT